MACPYCGALLDASHGKLSFLQLLEKPEHPPIIPLGGKGKLDGVEWICIGFMIRSCTVEGIRYPWEEYLLYNKNEGFNWLMQSNGHWVHLKPIDAGDVSLSPGVGAYYEGRRYKAFQAVTAVTEQVMGEFYWEVRAGETAQATEYVAPPYSVNEDATDNEVSFTHGEYLEPGVIEEAFKPKEPLPARSGIAPSQPNPNSAAPAWKWAGVWGTALLAIFLLVNVLAANETVLDTTVRLGPDALSGQPSAMNFSEPVRDQLARQRARGDLRPGEQRLAGRAGRPGEPGDARGDQLLRGGRLLQRERLGGRVDGGQPQRDGVPVLGASRHVRAAHHGGLRQLPGGQRLGALVPCEARQ